MPKPTVLLTFDCLAYADAWTLQHRLLEDRLAGRCLDTVLLLEHEPVFTVGRSGKPEHWGGDVMALEIAGIPVRHVERGGSITYHGPGQLVLYPIVRLDAACPGPKAYVRRLEEVVLRTLADWGLAGHRLEKQPGVWIGDPADGMSAKIAAVGVRIVRGVTMHGIALNVTVDLAPFGLVAPCGMAGCRVTSLQAALGRAVAPETVRRQLVRHLADVFDVEWTGGTAAARPSETEREAVASNGGIA